jgi:arylsulfatase A-like enzyme
VWFNSPAKTNAMKIRLPLLALLTSLVLSVSGANAPQRPNILFLLADDLRADTLGYAGDRIVQTPHLDTLAKRGTSFRNAFVTTSICCVSRASIFSGQYARRHGIEDFKTPFASAQWSNTYPALLRANGYRTGFIGKFGVGDVMPTNTFDYWDGFPGQGRYFATNDPVHLTHKMAESALRFVANRSQPFCLSISFKAPHVQDEALTRPFPPDAADEALYAKARIATPKNYSDAAFKRLPEFAQDSEGHMRWLRRFATPEMRDRNVKDYDRLITGMDREIGRILSAIEELGMATNTVVIFTSDNGYFLGERGLSDKFLMYEESIRVPLIVFDPRAPKTVRGQRRDEMALNIDLAPTLLDYAGISAPLAMQGKSLCALVGGRKPEWRNDWFYEHHFSFNGKIPESEGVRTKDWKYIRYTSVTPAVEELYNLRRDSAEERDLSKSHDAARQLSAMRERWMQLRESLR